MLGLVHCSLTSHGALTLAGRRNASTCAGASPRSRKLHCKLSQIRSLYALAPHALQQACIRPASIVPAAHIRCNPASVQYVVRAKPRPPNWHDDDKHKSIFSRDQLDQVWAKAVACRCCRLLGPTSMVI